MNDAHGLEQDAGTAERQDTFAALFAQLVMQQSNMALMLLGKVAHPETGQVVKDVEAARLFIDQLEMLEAKTKGNLDKDESALLKQSLMTLRLAFVQEVESPSQQTQVRPEHTSPPAQGGQSARPEKAAPSPDPSAGGEEEHRKKFSKKY